MFVANKCDLAHIITDKEIEEYSNKNNVKVFRTSAKDNISVEETFLYLGEEIIKKGVYKENKNAVLKDNSSSNEQNKKKKKIKFC